MNPYASPLLAEIFKNMPKALIVTIEYDPLREEGMQYAEKLAVANIPVLHLHYGRFVHSFPNMIGRVNSADLAMIDITKQLQDMLRKKF